MVQATAWILSLVVLLTYLHPGQTWGANYDKARQYESSRLRDFPRDRMRDHSRLLNSDFSRGSYVKPGANSYETVGRNNYGSVGNEYPQNMPYKPPQQPSRDSDYGNIPQEQVPPPNRNSGYGGNTYGGYDDNAREVVINDMPRPSIDDSIDGDNMEEAPAKKCRPFYSLNCERFCPAGNSLDPNGCRTCVCCPVLKCKGDCSHGVVTHGGCATCNCKTPPSHKLTSCPRKWCTKECKLGFVKDSNGCPLCKCKRRQYKTKWHSKFQ